MSMNESQLGQSNIFKNESDGVSLESIEYNGLDRENVKIVDVKDAQFNKVDFATRKEEAIILMVLMLCLLEIVLLTEAWKGKKFDPLIIILI
jgi:hypothetical protein